MPDEANSILSGIPSFLNAFLKGEGVCEDDEIREIDVTE